ncbi:MAG: hypothetical protein ACRDRQ_13540 [Pseudonocardiaceae bacterium]
MVRKNSTPVAPWTRPSPVPVVSTGLSVLQVPETCGWNPYVGAGAQALDRRGLTLLRPGLCCDNPRPAPLADLDALAGLSPDVVHLHWPEKLARQYGQAAALRVLTGFKERGALLVQSVHNLLPHEPSPALACFTARVDALTDGVHVFSAAHEQAARRVRPGLPGPVLRLAHPLLPQPPVPPGPRVPAPLSVGCLGRLRDYKGTLRFTRAFLDGAGDGARLLVAGCPGSTRTHRALAQLAAGDPRLDYRPGFVADPAHWCELLHKPAWVALPYEHLHSSGVLVAALQAGRRILSPTPLGGTALYTARAEPRWWLTVDPWDDRTAVALWRAAAGGGSAVPCDHLALPTWDQAAQELAAFYQRLRRTGRPVLVLTGAAPTRVGIL